MTLDEQGVDAAGDEILRFISSARNYTRIGELVEEIGKIASSGSWRRYRTASGTNEWREAEFDYFLISCDLPYEDVTRVIAYSKEAETLSALMERTTDEARRRSLEDASAEWKAAANETLLERAQRLSWTQKRTSGKSGVATASLRVPPLPVRFRRQQGDDLTNEKRARKNRAKRLPPERKAFLDSVVGELVNGLDNDTERRYLIDRLRDIQLSSDGG